MVKEFLSQCPEVIHQAEAARAAGQYKLASSKVREARADHPRGVVHLEDSQLSDLMRAWRIDVVANTSAAKRSWNGERAVNHLREAQEVIKTYYNYPAVQHRVPEIKYDNEGNQYDFEVEMLRDRARYCLAAASITGDNLFRIAALDFLDQAIISTSPDEETAEGLAWMEYGIIKKDFELIRDGYVESFQRSVAVGNLDRARWAARTYFGESLKRRSIIESLRALKDLHRVKQSLSKTAKDAVIGIVRSCELLSWPQHRLQRATLPKGFKSESLKIS